MIGVVLAPIILIGWFAPTVPLLQLLLRLTPQFAVLFAIGVAAAGLIDQEDWLRRLPCLALKAGVPSVAMIVWAGSEWTVQDLLMVDLTLGPANGLLAAPASGTEVRVGETVILAAAVAGSAIGVDFYASATSSRRSTSTWLSTTRRTLERKIYTPARNRVSSGKA
jgi:hypothetical protein